MRKLILMLAVMTCSTAMTVYAETTDAEIKLRKLDISGLSVNRDNLTLTATFDVRKAPIFDEVVFDFYLLLRPRDNDMKLQFLHCRTVHRYLDQKSNYESSVILDAEAVECIKPSKEKYAVVVTYKGKEMDVENSEQDRWWTDPALGPPVENMLRRNADVPIARVWESDR